MNEPMIKERDNSIDILRAFSMILIVLAHVNAPYVITQLRSFDVPLIVMVSGLCYTGCKNGYGQYVIKRFKRIYLPVFKFLLVFLGPFMALKLFGFNIPWDWDQIFGSFLLLDNPSIGFVWIMRVFLLMALISPVIHLIVNRLKLGGVIIFIALLLILNEILYYFYMPLNFCFDFLTHEILMYIIGYLPLLILGLYFRQKTINISRIALLCGIFICVWVSYSIYIGDLDISKSYKYPPRSWYVLYGMAISIILFYFRKMFSMLPILINRFLSFVSINSMWVYLWHIPFVYALNHILVGDNLWLMRWGLVLMGGCFTTQIQISLNSYAIKLRFMGNSKAHS